MHLLFVFIIFHQKIITPSLKPLFFSADITKAAEVWKIILNFIFLLFFFGGVGGGAFWTLFKMADLFRNEASDFLSEWIIESLIQMIHSETDSFRNETPQYCSEMHKCSDPALFGTIFIGETKRKQTILCLNWNTHYLLVFWTVVSKSIWHFWSCRYSGKLSKIILAK